MSTIDRRGFLTISALTLASIALSACEDNTTPPTKSPLTEAPIPRSNEENMKIIGNNIVLSVTRSQSPDYAIKTINPSKLVEDSNSPWSIRVILKNDAQETKQDQGRWHKTLVGYLVFTNPDGTYAITEFHQSSTGGDSNPFLCAESMALNPVTLVYGTDGTKVKEAYENHKSEVGKANSK